MRKSETGGRDVEHARATRAAQHAALAMSGMLTVALAGNAIVAAGDADGIAKGVALQGGGRSAAGKGAGNRLKHENECSNERDPRVPVPVPVCHAARSPIGPC